jgi:DNA-binding SARP family transcriptional activator/predicted ATPase
MNTPWRIEFFGGLRLWRGEDVTTRFRTRKISGLLALLAYHSDQMHPREELIDVFWPEADIHAGRNSLRVALSSLRGLLEPPGIAPGSVLDTSADAVRISSGAVWTDVAQFEAVAFAGEARDNATDRITHLSRAVDLYRGELLPGRYEEWVMTERDRLRDAFAAVLRSLSAQWEAGGDINRAIAYARRLTVVDRLNEASRCELIRLYMKAGEPAAAAREYREMVRVLREELGAEPSAETRHLMPRTGAAPHGASSARPAAEPPHPPIPAPSIPAIGRVGGGDHATQPPWPLPGTPHRLIGRSDELARIGGLIASADVRFVCVTGPPGCGKTRLALEAAAHARDHLNRAVWFVSVDDEADPSVIAERVLRAMRVRRLPEVDPLDQIVEATSGRRVVLVLDGLDKLAASGDAASIMLEDLALRAPSLQCILTTCTCLYLSGEQIVAAAPLETPAFDDSLPEMLRNPSVQLFLDAAGRAQPGFHAGPRNAAVIKAICRRLEGVPLSLELAAAWLTTLSPTELLARLDHPFDVLAPRRGGRAGTRESLHGALESSFQLLAPRMRTLFARLSVFHGGWTLESAETVCGDPHTVDGLMRLADASLITKSDTALGVSWFHMRDSLAAFAGEQLTPDERNATESAHAAYYACLADRALPSLEGRDASDWLDLLELHEQNLKAAVAWCLRPGKDAGAAVRIVRALWSLWGLRGHRPHDHDQLAELLERERAAAGIPEKALKYQGFLAFERGEYVTAFSRLGDYAAMLTEPGHMTEKAYVLDKMGESALRMGRMGDSRALREQSLSLFRSANNTWGQAMALGALGRVVGFQGHYRHGEALVGRALEMFRNLADEAAVATTLSALAYIAWCRGDLDEALRLETDSLERRRALRRLPGMVISLLHTGNIYRDRGAWKPAMAAYNECLSIVRGLGDRPSEASVLHNMAAAKLEAGDRDEAAAFICTAVALHAEQDGALAAVAALEVAAHIASATGRAEHAARLLGLCQTWREALGAPRHPVQWAAHSRARVHIEEALSAADMMAAMKEGYSLTPRRAMEEVLWALGLQHG